MLLDTSPQLCVINVHLDAHFAWRSSRLCIWLCVCVCVCVCVLYLLWEGEDVSMEHLECVLASVYEWLIGEYPCVISFGLNKLEA